MGGGSKTMSLYQGFYAIVVFWRKTCQAEIMMDRQGKLMKSSGLNFPVCKTVKSGKGCHLLTAHLKRLWVQIILMGMKILKKI